jgi:hypothetical protein
MTTSRKFAAAALAAAVLVTGLGSVNPASASSLTPEQAAIIAGTGGFILGAMIEGSHHQQSRVIYVEDSWDNHVSRCYARYRTYDESTDTYVGYDGYEHRCRM